MAKRKDKIAIKAKEYFENILKIRYIEKSPVVIL